MRGLPKEPKNYIHIPTTDFAEANRPVSAASRTAVSLHAVYKRAGERKNNFLSAAGSSLKTVLQWKQKKSLYLYIYVYTGCIYIHVPGVPPARTSRIGNATFPQRFGVVFKLR